MREYNMKNIKLLLILLLIVFIPFLVKAETCEKDKISIESIEIEEKSEFIEEIEKPIVDDKNIYLNISIPTVENTINYKLIIKNNSNEKYKIDINGLNSNSNYIEYKLETDDKLNIIKPNSSKTIYLTIKYKDEVPEDSFQNEKFIIDQNIKLNLISDDNIIANILNNPNTGNISLFIIIFILLIIGILFIVLGKKKYIKFIVLIIGLIPISIYATCKTEININSKVTIISKNSVAGVSLNYKNIFMLPPNTDEAEGTYKRTLTATVYPDTAINKELTWTSSDPNIATVDSNGVVLAKKAGTTTITVTTADGNKKASTSVRVESNELTNIYEISPSLLCALTRNISDNVRAMQGVYFYKSDNTAYALYAGYEADDKPTVMTLVNLNTCSVITKNNEQVYGHANDISYKDGKFYVVNSNKTHGVTVKNNNEIVLDDNPINMKFSFSGFEYDKNNKKFYSKAGNYMYTFPDLTSPKSDYKWIGIVPNYYSNIDEGQIKIVNQGLAYSNGNIYIPRTISNSSSSHYNHSYIQVYDANTGEYKYTMHFAGDYLCHLEGITIIDDSMYMGMNCHQANPRNQTFLIYSGLAEIENTYQNS